MIRMVALVLAVVMSLSLFAGVVRAADSCACNDDFELSAGGIWVKKGTVTAPSSGSGSGGWAPVGEAVKATANVVDQGAKTWSKWKFLREFGEVLAGAYAGAKGLAKHLTLPPVKHPNFYKGWGGH